MTEEHSHEWRIMGSGLRDRQVAGLDYVARELALEVEIECACGLAYQVNGTMQFPYPATATATSADHPWEFDADNELCLLATDEGLAWEESN